MIFASVTAEEQGLLCSEYPGQHPPIPAGQITLDLNYDAIHPFGDSLETNVAGSEQTSFYPAVKATAKSFGLGIVADANPEATLQSVGPFLDGTGVRAVVLDWRGDAGHGARFGVGVGERG